MTSGPLVSVVVPFLNAEAFLGEAIGSVFAQTYGHWELLLVDDGSSDASSKIASDYAAQHAGRVSYLAYPDHRRQGPAAARNLGLARAKGDYLAFLDADDVWLPSKLEHQMRIFRTRPEIGMLYGSTQWWYSWNERAEDRKRDYVEDLGVPTDVLIEPPSLLRPYFALQEAAIPSINSVIVPRWVVERVGDFERSVPDGYEDQAFYAKICVHAPILVSSECWDRYRQHAASLTEVRSRHGQDAAARARFLTWLIEYLADHGLGDGQVSAEVRRQRFRYRHPRLADLVTRMQWSVRPAR